MSTSLLRRAGHGQTALLGDLRSSDRCRAGERAGSDPHCPSATRTCWGCGRRPRSGLRLGRGLPHVPRRPVQVGAGEVGTAPAASRHLDPTALPSRARRMGLRARSLALSIIGSREAGAGRASKTLGLLAARFRTEINRRALLHAILTALAPITSSSSRTGIRTIGDCRIEDWRLSDCDWGLAHIEDARFLRGKILQRDESQSAALRHPNHPNPISRRIASNRSITQSANR